MFTFFIHLLIGDMWVPAEPAILVAWKSKDIAISVAKGICRGRSWRVMDNEGSVVGLWRNEADAAMFLAGTGAAT